MQKYVFSTIILGGIRETWVFAHLWGSSPLGCGTRALPSQAGVVSFFPTEGLDIETSPQVGRGSEALGLLLPNIPGVVSRLLPGGRGFGSFPVADASRASF